VGQVPLPPYIHVDLDDPERYQTVYARTPGSVAAPTAGLHLTDRVLDACRERGVRIERVELQVGLGTFRPIAADHVEDHVMHEEAYRVEPAVLDACHRARAHGSRVVAVGTTTLRTLEAVEATGALEGRTDIYLHGDVRPTLVDTLLTNFHVPRSSLLVLVDAFVGPRWRRLYDTALADGYRFLSFGDCCLLDGRPGRAG
jgi:S-adenosylmethionine:tRNA ribosyltransferase-isomerase